MAADHALMKVRLKHWFEAVFLQCERASGSNGNSCYVDALMFPVVAALCLDTLEKSVAEGLISALEAQPVFDRKSEIKLVRDMIEHIAEYDAGSGLYPAKDDKSFDGIYREASGRVHIAHRIEVLDCAGRFQKVAQALSARNYWGNSRKPRGI